MPKLTGNTVVSHPETYQPVVLLTGSDLPVWAVGLVGDHLLDEPAGDPSVTEEYPEATREAPKPSRGRRQQK